jgi:hypothetical protein
MQTKTGAFDSLTTMQKITVESNADPIDFCPAAMASIIDVYIVDLDGSLRPPSISVPPTGAATLVSDQPNMLKFVDPSKCTPLVKRCYRYCQSTCFRTVRYEIDPAGTDSLVLKVCIKTISGSTSTSCIFVAGNARTEDPTFSKRPRVYGTHLPMGMYNAVFVNSSGTAVWPSFVNVTYKEVLCPGSFVDGAVNLTIPPFQLDSSGNAAECTQLVRNGNFEESVTETKFWLQSAGGIQLDRSAGEGHSHAASGIALSDLTTFVQFIDTRCVGATVGQFYAISASIKLTNVDGSVYTCNPSQQVCPDIGILTDDGFHRVATVSLTRDANGFQSANGFVQIDSHMAASVAVAVYVRSNVNGRLMTVDNVAMQLQTANRYCNNLVQGSDMESSAWLALWTSNTPGGSNTTDVFTSVTPGYNSHTAVRFSNRNSSREGPMYAAFRNVDTACLTQGSSWSLVAQLKLVDHKTGVGATCNVNIKYDCPSIRLAIRDGTGYRFFYQKWSTYVNAAGSTTGWTAGAYNAFRANFTLPAASAWDGSVKNAVLDIRDFPAGYDLIFDNVALVPAV